MILDRVGGDVPADVADDGGRHDVGLCTFMHRSRPTSLPVLGTLLIRREEG